MGIDKMLMFDFITVDIMGVGGITVHNLLLFNRL